MVESTTRGTLYGVSVGPGDPELMTLQAVRCLQRCSVIAAPQTKSGQMLALEIARGAVELDDKIILPLHFPMSRDKDQQRTAHENAARALQEHLDAGQDVAMLNLGDVSVYATFGYIQTILQEQGYATRMLAGVPSFCASAARLNQPLTAAMDQPLTIAPGSAADTVLDIPGSKVLMKPAVSCPGHWRPWRLTASWPTALWSATVACRGRKCGRIFRSMMRTVRQGILPPFW